MNNEWLDLAYINFDKVIMHGQILKKEQHASFYISGYPAQIEQVLTREQQREIEELRFKHEREVLELLKSFVND